MKYNFNKSRINTGSKAISGGGAHYRKYNYKQVLVIIFFAIVVISIAGLSYSFFAIDPTGKNQTANLQTGNLSLVFSDGNAGINEKLEFGRSVVKTFTVENNGTLDAGFIIKWKDLINTYGKGSLGYTLESASSETGPYTIETTDNSLFKWYENEPLFPAKYIEKINEHVNGSLSFEELTEFLYGESISNIPEENLQELRNVIERFRFTRNQELVPTVSTNLSNNMKIKSGEKKFYKLTITLNDYPEINQTNDLDAIFSSLFEIEEGLTPIARELMKRAYDDKIWKHSEDISSIIFEDKLEPKANAAYTYDISELQDGSVISYLVPVSGTNAPYTAYIQADGDIIANPDCSNLFAYFSSLENIVGLENLNTNYVRNMSLMFGGCSSLTELNVNNFDTSNVTDMSFMFTQCEGLTSLDVSNFDTSNVTNMAGMFYGCSNLTTLDVSNFDTSNVTNMTSTFNSCSSLTELNVNNFDTSNVTDMSFMFYGCSNLTTLDVSNFDTSNVIYMFAMFQNCRSLTELNVSNFDTSNVTDMALMFSNCSSLTELKVSNFDTSKVTNMYGMFGSCSSLTELNVDNFDTSNVTDMAIMFSDCSSLTKLKVSSFDTSNVIYMYAMFQNCRSLAELNVSNFDTSNVTDMHSMFVGCSKLTTTITIKGTKCTDYSYMFSRAATVGGAQITVNYTKDASSLVDSMIATKSATSNVVKASSPVV